MLIDFSSRLQVSVYSIGATFLKMVKKLHITELPLADPSLFIQHFAEKLDLADKKIKVVKDAVKLAQRMSKDWMFEGRRPAGIAGACILLACRMNNLRRTHTEIVSVSHVAEETLQQRLNEFKNTKAAKLSVQKFRENDVEDGDSRPPSFVKNRKKEKKIKSTLDKEEMFQTSEEALNKNPILTQVLGEQELSSKEVLFYLKQFSERRARDVERIKATNGIDGEDVYHEDPERDTKKRKTSGTDAEEKKREGEEDGMEENKRQDKKSKTNPSREDEEKEAGHFQDAIDGYSLKTDPYCPRNLHLLPTTDAYLSKVSDDPENLEDVDDDELNAHLLSEEASKLKERIWIGLNADFLLEQESKRLKQEADIATGNTSVKKKRVRRKNNTRNNEPTKTVDAAAAIGLMSDLQDKSGLHAALKAAEENGDFTTADSVKNMLQKASFSKKINYDAIDGLFR